MINGVKRKFRRLVCRPLVPTPIPYLPSRQYPDDVFLVAFPKSGITWLRFILGNYLTGNQLDFTNQHLFMPDIHMEPGACDTMARPRLIMSHVPQVSEYRRVVYLVRDGRDVAVSFYYYAMKIGAICKTVDFADFLTVFESGVLKHFGPWGEHVHSWLDCPSGDFLLLRYEDLKADPFGNACRVLQFAGLKLDERALRSAIAASTLERMRRQEQDANDELTRIVKGHFDTSIPFVRSGQVAQWTTYFTPTQLERFVEVHGSALARLGYATAKAGPQDKGCASTAA